MSEVSQSARPPQKKWSVLVGIAMLVMLLVGAVVGLYLTQINQDLRQQASEVYGPGPTGTPGDGEVNVWCSGCGGFWMSQEEFNQGWGCNTASFQRCGDYPDQGGNGNYCDSNGCDGGGSCTVIKYQCNRNTNLGGGCQDRQVAASTGRLNFSASCGSEQIDVSCNGAPDTDFVSRIYPTACGETPNPTATPTPPGSRTPTPTPTRRLTPTPTPTGTLTPTPTPTPSPSPTPPVGPQCHSIVMYNPAVQLLTGADDQDFVPGETKVYFVCSTDPTNAAPPTGYHYKFRVYEPCGSPNHSTPIEFTSTDSDMEYDIEYSGHHAAQCAVCPNGGTSAQCDWEAYTPTSC